MLDPDEYRKISPATTVHFPLDFLLHFIPLACLALLICGFGLIFLKDLRVERIKIRERNLVAYERGVIQTDLAAHASDAMLLSDMLASGYSLPQNEGISHPLAGKLFLSLSRVMHVYDQVRYLDAEGQEKIRVNFAKGIPRLLEAQKLQKKGDRPYFKETMDVPSGHVLISRFDLNIEHGRIERPIKPMLRFSTPVDDSQGRRRGMVILNYFGDRLIRMIQGIAESGEGNVFLLNDKGYWFIGPTPEEEWGFMLGKERVGNVKNRYPRLWSDIQKTKNGQVIIGDHLFTFVTMTATPPALQQATAYPRLVESEHWVVISRVSLRLLEMEYTRIGIFLGVFILLALGTICWFWSSARKKKSLAEAQLYHMAMTDGLTSLANRRRFVHCVQGEIERAKRYGRGLSLVLFDIDHFKMINDTYGHDQGDEVLKDLAQCTRDVCREQDIVGRVGGEEFAVLLPETEIDQAGVMAERLREAMEKIVIQCPQGEIRFTISLGVTSLSKDSGEQNFQTLFKQADTAMYQAKESGRNRIVII